MNSPIRTPNRKRVTRATPIRMTVEERARYQDLLDFHSPDVARRMIRNERVSPVVHRQPARVPRPRAARPGAPRVRDREVPPPAFRRLNFD